MIITHRVRVTVIAILYLPLVLLGVYMAWKAAPDAESALMPPLTDVYYVPFDPAHPEQLFAQQLDRTCWRMHFHKARTMAPLVYAVTWISANGGRYFSEPVSAMTGYSLDGLNAKPAGFTGDAAICSIMPDNFDAAAGYDISIYTQYDPPHHLWPVEERFPLIHVPGATE